MSKSTNELQYMNMGDSFDDITLKICEKKRKI